MKQATKLNQVMLLIKSLSKAEKRYIRLYTNLQNGDKHYMYLQPIITQYFIDNKSEIWLLFLIAHSKR